MTPSLMELNVRRMRWLWGLCVALAVFTAVTAKPAGLGEPDQTELELESEFISELLTNLLVPAERQAREIADEQDEEEVVEITEVETAEVEGEAMEDSEALKEAKMVEVSRFNNYIDAIYRRMNAALKAKLMDPMELNLDEKAKKNEAKKGKSEKTRVLREAIDEEDTETDVDRMGKPAKTEKKAGKFKGMSKQERLAEKKKRREMKKKENDAKDKKAEMKEKKMEAKEKKKEMKEKKEKNMEMKAKKEKKMEMKAKKEKKMELKAKKSKEPKEKKMEAKRNRKNKVERESRSNRRNKNKKKGQNKNKKTNKQKNNNKRGKDSKKNTEKKARKGSDGKDEKMVGSLSGIATMMRDGDVTVVDEETHKVVTSEFSVGPLQLQVSKIVSSPQVDIN